jgi:two-component system response regulator HydG
METQRLLVVEDDASVRNTISTFLELEGYAVDAVSSTREALDRIKRDDYPIVISDIYVDDRTGLDVLDAARNKDPDCSVILMTARGTMETVMAATRGGVFDYIAKPFELDRILETVKRAEASREGIDDPFETEPMPTTEMIGASSAMIDVYKTVSRVAPTDATVLIEGETGTGKEMIARMVHQFSRRTSMPFVPVDCGAIASSLLESELFGAMRGAFTGADRDRIGVIESANRGTVFLDEREVRPVGASRAKAVDVRVVAATNRDLQKMVEDGRFREDLWFRLNVVRVRVPPLRERRADVALLAQFFLGIYNTRYDRGVIMTDSGVKTLQEQMWPGNVRQLQHLIERLTILAPQGRIDSEAVLDAVRDSEAQEAGESLADTEAEQIRRVLAATGGNKSRAAQILGIERKTLYRKLERMR